MQTTIECSGCKVFLQGTFHTCYGSKYCSNCMFNNYNCAICGSITLSKTYSRSLLCEYCYYKTTGIKVINAKILEDSTFNIVCFYCPNTMLQTLLGPLLLAAYDETTVDNAINSIIDISKLLSAVELNVRGALSSIKIESTKEYSIYECVALFANNEGKLDKRIVFVNDAYEYKVKFTCKVVNNEITEVNTIGNIYMNISNNNILVNNEWFKTMYFTSMPLNVLAIKKIKNLMLGYKLSVRK